jgi:hypothetical protein
MHLESRGLAANTINQQLAAVRRLAHEAADSGLLSPELAAGISRVKGVKQLGFRSGNWLSAEESSEVLKRACGDSMRAKRDYAIILTTGKAIRWICQIEGRVDAHNRIDMSELGMGWSGAASMPQSLGHHSWNANC